ncbi:MAG: DNA-processing protein DprA [Armatimonadota bacterium]
MTEAFISDNAAVRLFLEVIALKNQNDEAVLCFSPADIKLIDYALSQHGKQPKHLLNMHNYSEIGIDRQTAGELEEHLAQTIGPMDVLGIIRAQFASWTRQGISLIHYDDEQYPAIWRVRLGQTAPKLIWCAGNLELLASQGLAVVGSRVLSEEEQSYASRLGHECARQQLLLISGYASGADQLAMFAALDEGGQAIGILSQGLLGVLGQARLKKPLQKDQLLLISPFHPSAEFQAAQALARNRLIYSMGQWAVAVSSRAGTGGTWRGALECMVQSQPPLYVRCDQPISDGNQRLLELGALELDAESLGYGVKLADYLQRTAVSYKPSAEVGELLAEIGPSPDDFDSLRRKPESSSTSKRSPKPEPEELSTEMFDSAWKLMEPLLGEPSTPQQLAHALSITRSQALAWLKQAEGLGMVSRSGKPPRFLRTPELYREESE